MSSLTRAKYLLLKHGMLAGALALSAGLVGCRGDIGDTDIDGPIDEGPVVVVPEKCPTCIGVSRLARLTQSEYEGTVRRVFGESLAATFEFGRLPGDGTAGPFSSNANLLVDAESVQAYRDVAERAAPTLAEAAGCADRACALEYATRIGEGLYRRSLTSDELDAIMALYDGAGDPATGIRLTVTALLQMPQFLYRVELGREVVNTDTVALTGREVATRLAYFFWRESPDADLLASADAGSLDTAEGVRVEAERLLADPRADRMIRDFHSGWLGLAYAEQRTLNPADFPDFEQLQPDMLAETTAFTLSLMRGSGSYRDLYTADYTFASDALAEFYGASAGTVGPESDLPRVELDGSRRAGLLTQSAVILAHTTDPSTAGVHRGKFIRENLLCLTLPPPPPVDAVVQPDESLSTRERFEAKTSPSGCTGCHTLLNPTGFLLEHYDLLGTWRDMDGTFPIDASGGLPGSDVVGDLDGAIELGNALANSEMAQRCMVNQWFRYAMSRSESASDATTLDEAYEAFEASDFNLRELVISLAASPSFRLRRAPAAE